MTKEFQAQREPGMWIDADQVRLLYRLVKPGNVHIPPFPEDEQALLDRFAEQARVLEEQGRQS